MLKNFNSAMYFPTTSYLTAQTIGKRVRLCHFLSVSQFFKPIISKYIKMNKLSIEKANLLIVTTDDSLLINNKIM